MTTKIKTLLAIAGIAMAWQASAACDYPNAPTDLPTGDTESQEDMLTAQQAVKEYVKSMEDYLACLDTQFDALGSDATEEHALIRDKRYNAAVSVMDATASQFNQAVRTFKARGE